MNRELPRSSAGPVRRAVLFGATAAIGAALLPLASPVAQSATRSTTRKSATTKKTATTARKTATTTRRASTTVAPEETTTTVGSTSSTSSTRPPTTPPVGPGGQVTWFIPGTGKVLDFGAADVGKLAGGARATIDVRGQSGLAATGTGSVILDITARTPTQTGKVTLTPVAAPYAQSVVTASAQFVSGATTINRIAVPVGENAQIRVETTPGPQGLTIEVVGWVVNSAAGVVETRGFALQPCRVVDSTTGIGLSGLVTPSRPFDIPAAGVGKIPASSAASPPSMVMIAVGLSGATQPTAMNILPTGQQTPALSITAIPGNNPSGVYAIPVGADPRVAFYVTSGSSNLTVDILGFTDKDGNGASAGPC
jgi:hypothetical protein